MSSEENKKQFILSQSTLLPIGAVIVIIGAVMWLANVSYMAQSAQNTAEANANRITQIEAQNASILDRMARIETKIDVLIEAISK